MIRVAVVGAAGRMGRRLVANICEAEDMELSGAVEYTESPFIGHDAGEVAACGKCDVIITADIKDFLFDTDAIIDFSTGPVVENATIAVAEDCTVIIGTTALGDKDKAALQKLADTGGRIVFASNMSVGVNLLFHLSQMVAGILDDDYDIEIIEMHHNQKKDAPSGTAVTLAEKVVEAREKSYSEDVIHGREGMVGKRPRGEIGMHAVRGGDVVGDHTVIFATQGERIELIHKASSRDTFAKGALRAVRFLSDKTPGLYDMQDVLNLKK
jgi:4-hydroxy-tetrahydrodipicolinate reductase